MSDCGENSVANYPFNLGFTPRMTMAAYLWGDWTYPKLYGEKFTTLLEEQKGMLAEAADQVVGFLPWFGGQNSGSGSFEEFKIAIECVQSKIGLSVTLRDILSSKTTDWPAEVGDIEIASTFLWFCGFPAFYLSVPDDSKVRNKIRGLFDGTSELGKPLLEVLAKRKFRDGFELPKSAFRDDELLAFKMANNSGITRIFPSSRGGRFQEAAGNGCCCIPSSTLPGGRCVQSINEDDWCILIHNGTTECMGNSDLCINT